MHILRCEKCGGTWLLQIHHIIFRSQAPKEMLELEENKIHLCGLCHSFAHSYPNIFKVWLEEKYPGRYDKLIQLKKQYSKKVNRIENNVN